MDTRKNWLMNMNASQKRVHLGRLKGGPERNNKAGGEGQQVQLGFGSGSQVLRGAVESRRHNRGGAGPRIIWTGPEQGKNATGWWLDLWKN